MLYQVLKPVSKIKDKDLVPLELIDKKEIIEKLLNLQHSKTAQNMEYINSYGNRNVDSKLLKT